LRKFDAERCVNFCSPKFFSLQKKPPNPKIWDNPHGHQQWWPPTVSPPKALRQAAQLPLQQKNHQVPHLHTVAASLCTVVHPQWHYRPFIITPTDRVQSDLTLYVLGLSMSHLNQKKILFAKFFQSDPKLMHSNILIF
jgi:hypothetical protein